MKKTWHWAILAALLALGMVVARLVWAGAAYYERGAAVEERDPVQACLWYGEAMRAYLPLYHPNFDRGMAALERLAKSAEERGDMKLALFAREEIHASLRSVRSFYQPLPDELARSEEEIRRLNEKFAAASSPSAEVPPPSAAVSP